MIRLPSGRSRRSSPGATHGRPQGRRDFSYLTIDSASIIAEKLPNLSMMMTRPRHPIGVRRADATAAAASPRPLARRRRRYRSRKPAAPPAARRDPSVEGRTGPRQPSVAQEAAVTARTTAPSREAIGPSNPLSAPGTAGRHARPAGSGVPCRHPGPPRRGEAFPRERSGTSARSRMRPASTS